LAKVNWGCAPRPRLPFCAIKKVAKNGPAVVLPFGCPHFNRLQQSVPKNSLRSNSFVTIGSADAHCVRLRQMGEFGAK